MASGDTLMVLVPQDNEPPSSNYATLDTRNGHLVLDFDASTDEAACFRGILPSHYAGGGITIKIHYAMTSATSGNVIWQTAIERVSDSQQDIDSDGFATANSSGAVAVPGTSGHVDICSVAHASGAEMDSLAVGEGFRLKVNRDADNGSDTATGDAELWAIELVET